MSRRIIRMQGGEYAGWRVTAVPKPHLRWLVGHGEGGDVERAQAELDRRGDTPDKPDVDVTPHAIDRLSLYGLGKYRETRKKNEGLHTWAARMSWEAYQYHQKTGKLRYEGLVWCLHVDSRPYLATVYRDKKPGVRGVTGK